LTCFAGTGNDPRDRQFRTVSQGEQYDPEARLCKLWVPELAHLPADLAHRPWLAPAAASEVGQGQTGGGTVVAEAEAAGASRAEGREQPGPAGWQGSAVEGGVPRQPATLQEGQPAIGQGDGDAASGHWGSYPPPMVDPITQIRREAGLGQPGQRRR
jgi:hypothetical protein